MKPIPVAAAAIEWLLLQRLSYEWDDEDYNLLKQLTSDQPTIPSAVLFSHEHGAEHTSWFCAPTTENDHFFTPMLSMCETVVIRDVVSRRFAEAHVWPNTTATGKKNVIF